MAELMGKVGKKETVIKKKRLNHEKIARFPNGGVRHGDGDFWITGSKLGGEAKPNVLKSVKLQ